MIRQIFAKIEELEQQYQQVWEAFCAIESPTLFKEGVDAAGEYIAQLAREKGWLVEYCCQDVAGDAVCITMNPDAAAAPLAISGHVDTVHPVGLFGTPAVRRESDTIHGPGVMDCKGGIVAGLLAMDALAQCGFAVRPVLLLLQSDEEVGSRLSDKSTIRWICEKAKDAAAFLNLEPYTPGFACLQRKGIVSYRFTIKGVEAHASMCATEGASAIADAAHRILELEKLKDADGITCNCGVISGGTVVNTVPGACTFDVNFRFVSPDQFDWIATFMEKLAQTEYIPGCVCMAQRLSMRVAMQLEQRNLDLLETCNRIFVENGLPQLEWRSQNGGSDAADATTFGIPCIDSLGVAGSNIHSVHESASLSSLGEAARRIAAVACGL